MQLHVNFFCRTEPTGCASFIERDLAAFLPRPPPPLMEGRRADGGRGLWVAAGASPPSAAASAVDEARRLVGVEGVEGVEEEEEEEEGRAGSAGPASSPASSPDDEELLAVLLEPVVPIGICARPSKRGLAPRTFFFVPACDRFSSSSWAADFCCRFIK